MAGSENIKTEARLKGAVDCGMSAKKGIKDGRRKKATIKEESE